MALCMAERCSGSASCQECPKNSIQVQKMRHERIAT